MSSPPIFYDDSLPIAVTTVSGFIDAAWDACTFLRDGQGRLHVYVDSLEIDAEGLEKALKANLHGYAPSFGPIVKLGLPSGDPSLVVVGNMRIRYIERRFAGTDWAQQPAGLAKPPRLVFFSIKGGVGRTTALSVLATSLALQSRRVLVVDLDLEAPGLGSVLLAEQEWPEFGALDWLTEAAVQPAGLPPLKSLVAVSQIGRNAGRIDVVPAFGRRCAENPTAVLSKLARIVVETGNPSGLRTFGSRVRDFVDALVSDQLYDAVLIDARAGLSEISAAPLIGLGADVLFFMSDNAQSFLTYTALLAHLQRFAPVRSDFENDDDWRLRIKAVRGRVVNPGDPLAFARFNDRCFEIFSSTIYDAEDVSGDQESFTFDVDDAQAPHNAIEIAFDPRFQLYEPLQIAEQARPEVLRSAFGGFVDWCSERLGIGEEP